MLCGAVLYSVVLSGAVLYSVILCGADLYIVVLCGAVFYSAYIQAETHTKISNTKPFLCNIKGPRYLQNKKQFLNRLIHIHTVS